MPYQHRGSLRGSSTSTMVGLSHTGRVGSGNVLRMRVPLMIMLKYAWIEKAETHTPLEVAHRQLDAFWDLFPNLFFVTGFRG